MHFGGGGERSGPGGTPVQRPRGFVMHPLLAPFGRRSEPSGPQFPTETESLPLMLRSLVVGFLKGDVEKWGDQKFRFHPKSKGSDPLEGLKQQRDEIRFSLTITESGRRVERCSGKEATQ